MGATHTPDRSTLFLHPAHTWAGERGEGFVPWAYAAPLPPKKNHQKNSKQSTAHHAVDNWKKLKLIKSQQQNTNS